jgi:choline dehydrogenase-like flavoprotein
MHHKSSAMHRPNLFILVGADVTAILSSDSEDESEVKASGIEFRHGITDMLHRAHIRREVILSAGTIKSPQILELSGIGRPDVLSKHGVKVKVPLNGVGENVQDHLFIGCTYRKMPFLNVSIIIDTVV